MPVMIIEQKTNVKIFKNLFKKSLRRLTHPPRGGGGVSESFVLKAFYSPFHKYLRAASETWFLKCPEILDIAKQKWTFSVFGYLTSFRMVLDVPNQNYGMSRYYFCPRTSSNSYWRPRYQLRKWHNNSNKSGHSPSEVRGGGGADPATVLMIFR